MVIDQLTNFDSLGWFLLLLVAFPFLQRQLHFETQAVLLLITRRPDISLILFSILFFPGVLLHEISHYLTARLLRVHTGRFSLLPQPLPDGRLRLGYVETASTDVVRDALIGIAPLFTGGAFVVYAGLIPLGLPMIWDGLVRGDLAQFFTSLASLHTRPDFWVWFYLTFATSSTMLPSASDRRAWLPIGLFFFLAVGLAILAGGGPWLAGLWMSFAPRTDGALRTAALVFGISAALHLVLLLPLWALRKMLSYLTGVKVGVN